MPGYRNQTPANDLRHPKIESEINVLLSFDSISAATLDKKGASVTWGAKDTEDFGASSERLHLRQILLGHSAKPDEYNVVEVSITKKKKINQFFHIFRYSK